jgi:hypothetical protein
VPLGAPLQQQRIRVDDVTHVQQFAANIEIPHAKARRLLTSTDASELERHVGQHELRALPWPGVAETPRNDDVQPTGDAPRLECQLRGRL